MSDENHGKEAERLRSGIESILEEYSLTMKSSETDGWLLLRALRKLLNETPSDDSCHYVTSQENKRIGELTAEDAAKRLAKWIELEELLPKVTRRWGPEDVVRAIRSIMDKP